GEPLRGERRVAWYGPPLLIEAQSVVSLALVLHELSTNAAKYGAFSNGSGRVEVAWQRLGGGMAELRWTELGGPPVTREPVPGFGNKLISRVIGYDMRGSAAMRFEPDGLRCRLTFRVADAAEFEAANAAPLTA